MRSAAAAAPSARRRRRTALERGDPQVPPVGQGEGAGEGAMAVIVAPRAPGGTPPPGRRLTAARGEPHATGGRSTPPEASFLPEVSPMVGRKRLPLAAGLFALAPIAPVLTPPRGV